MTQEEFNELKCGDIVISERQSQFVIILKMNYKDRLIYVAEHQGEDRNIAVLLNPLNFVKIKSIIPLGGSYESKN